MKPRMAQRVLIVEDEQHLAEGLRFNLEAEGYDADVVDTGERALQRLEDHPGLVILADTYYPGADWRESSLPAGSMMDGSRPAVVVCVVHV